MAIIVMHVKSETNFVLLGTGYGSWATESPGTLGRVDRNDGTESVAYVCDAEGKIRKVRPADLVVVSVDGAVPSELLSPPPPAATLP